MTNIYKFTSTDTMTAKEVADIMQVLIVSLLQAIQQRQPTGNEDLEIDESIYVNLPEKLKGFFTASNSDPSAS